MEKYPLLLIFTKTKSILDVIHGKKNQSFVVFTKPQKLKYNTW
jgi:hypothetical protein